MLLQFAETSYGSRELCRELVPSLGTHAASWKE